MTPPMPPRVAAADADLGSQGAAERAAAVIESVRLIVGMEVHIELRTRRKVFAHAASPAHPATWARGGPGWAAGGEGVPNVLLDPVTLALPGALPVLNREAVELSMLVGLALSCGIAEHAVWDRKGYTYPDLPKGYQISQYELPICFDGRFDMPHLNEDGEPTDEGESRPIGIIRAHLEEDAGKLLHEAPGGGAVEGSLVDLNRAGTALLEVVTQPDFRSADEAVYFARGLRHIARFLGATEGVMQKGHIRFEPNINCELTLSGGRTVKTPIVEVKNLNSFKAVKGAIEFERREQPERWRRTGVELAGGTKQTRGWDDARGVTVPQREKEEAHDYRYFPDPDLPPVRVDAAWRERVAARLVELPAARAARYASAWGVPRGEAAQLVEERAVAEFFEGAVAHAASRGVAPAAAARQAANLVLQVGARLANERAASKSGGAGAGEVLVSELGVSAAQAGQIAALRESGRVAAASAAKLFEKLCDPEYAGRDAEAVAEYEGWLVVRDERALAAWCEEAMAADPASVAQVRAGKVQAVGRLIGDVMKRSGGSADAAAARAMLLEKINAGA